MLIRPSDADLRLIAYYLGKALLGIGIMMVPPFVVALLLGEFDSASALGVGIAVAVGVWQFAEWRWQSRAALSWSHGLVIVAASWLFGAAITAIPLALSGHYVSLLDAYFDAMSGLTTSGLAVVQDLDHMSVSMNLLRHMTHFAGGQGIVIVLLTMAASSGGDVSTLYFGEGRDERIVPNVVATARFIYLVAGTWLVAGTAALWIASMVAGFAPLRGLFHAVSLFMAAFDTGGFAPYSPSVSYYHSAMVESVLIVLMVAGALSFGIHHAMWRRDPRRVWRDSELRTLGLTTTLTIAITVLGLGYAGAFTHVGPLMRKGVFTVISAHTGTGFGVNAPRLFVTDWGEIAPAVIVVAMALGGMASSTTGGLKAVRVGLTAKSVGRDIRRATQPDAAVVVTTWTQRHRRIVTDQQVRSAVTILVLFVLLYLGGAVVGVYYGFPFDQALFESTSAAASVGLSVGVLGAAPDALKVVYIIQMWLGRLEFLAVFALLGYGWSLVRGRI